MNTEATSGGVQRPERPATSRRRFSRGAAILPSLFTTGNLFLGFWAIVRTFHGQYAEAAPLIFWAILLDVLDGRIARLTGTTSEFGAELDSLADVVSFGVAPALLAYSWGFATLPRVGWLVAFLFIVCGALRLARFNVQKSSVDGRYFVGLPIPAAAAPVAALVNVSPQPVDERTHAVVWLSLLIVLSFLMVSTFRYTSFKKVDLRSRRSYVNVVGIALLLIVFNMHPGWCLLALATLFWLSGPLVYLWGLVFRRRPGPPPVVAASEAP
ncbi:MAG TPA: CDP-diacylglycerol--serine O-phosphatidyltransferase [Vicinamibacteria bacterium]|jgi:CDP-diacylglycerol--serine O-phosphatidyltransferase|nr:CDP-diacylglycerol--serine O-phosphatidyltransferase [Vicinamibacteria bacterium]